MCRMQSETVPDLPHITSENFEERVSSDSVLVEFLNAFLQLPTFLEPVRYNTERGLFEVGIDSAETLSTQITALLNELKEKSNDPGWFPDKPLVDNSYTVSCLDQAQATEWIRRERLPFFLQSDCYFEYRLASCLYQMASTKQRLFRQVAMPQYEVSQRSPTQCGTPLNTGHPDHSSDHSLPHTDCSAISPRPMEARDHYIEASTPTTVQSNFADTQLQIHKDMDDESDRTQNWDQCSNLPLCVCKCVARRHSEICPVVEKNGKTKRNPVWLKQQPSTALSDLIHTPASLERTTGVCGSRQLLLDFKSSLQGRPGENVLNLWMDIERLKTLHNLEAKNRHIVWMKNQYSSALSVEFLSRLDLISPHCWTGDRLHIVQLCLTEILLLYWGWRFVNSHSHTERGAKTFLWPCWVCQLSLPGLQSCLHHPSPTPQQCASSSQILRTPSMIGIQHSEMERMQQALCVESRAGFFFTHFCQNSGSQLWANAAQFYRELLEYHQLFYQSTLDTYRVQRKAQVLYATYVCSTARRNVSVREQCRHYILTHLTTPFEELFDQAEEHTLLLLLEPWTVLTHQDSNTFRRVAVWEEERLVEPELYKTLQSQYMQMHCRQQQGAHKHKPPPRAEDTKEPDFWTKVPQQFQHYRLGVLLRNRLELQHFLSFLEVNFASMDLLCWLDIEQLKRTPNDADTWEDKCKNIRSQYLSRKYLFGPSSPANKHQQTELLNLAGGWAHLQCGPLTMSVLAEVQSLVKSRIERKWLPLFLSSKDFITRQKIQVELGDVVEDQLFLRHRKKRQVWKQVDRGLMSSSQEVMALRRALLNPMTCMHFRLFLSLRGELLENDLHFWLEVQRYKDLCHSHCDETTVQQKVSTIISCFIDSCIPPSVQIHLPPEQAELILQRRSTLGPYIFREAQMCVFTELLKHWPAFVEFKSSMCEEQVLSELEKRRSRERERQRKAERNQQDGRTSALLQGERGSVLEGLIAEATLYGEGVEDEETEECGRLHVVGKLVSWSYSKYLAALEREEILIHKQAIQEERADSSSVHSRRSSAHTNSRRSSGKNTGPPFRAHTPQSAPMPVKGN